MSAIILDGRTIAAQLKHKLAHRIVSLQRKHKIVPGLAVIQAGDHQASQVYVASKMRQCQEIGIRSFQAIFQEKTPHDEILKQIDRFNADPQVHGILVQMPLPLHLNFERIINAINPSKDVDGLHPKNLGALMTGNPFIVPCTPQGCLTLLQQYQKNLNGLHVVIIGRSILVGKPLALLLLQENCTIVIAHSKTRHLPELCRQADILVAAAGRPRLVKGSWIKPGAVVLDIGINRVVNKDGTFDLMGDVDFQEVKEIAGAITPVPGGVGPMTVAMLLQNTVKLMTYQAGLV